MCVKCAWPEAVWDVSGVGDMCLCLGCGCVGVIVGSGWWLGTRSGRVGWCCVCVSCESGLVV